MREAPKSPPPPPPVRDLAAELGDAIQGGTLIVGPGQFSPWPERARVGVLRVDGEPSLLWDGFRPVVEIPVLCEALAGGARVVWPGAFDMMYATPWKWA